ncbi:MAG: response regulator transcription factor [Bacillota bacterium]|nr:response regulator transcription factor [Bacillota bacterium]
MIRLLLVDDHEVVRRGLRAILQVDPELEVAGEAATAEEAVEQARRLRPDVVLLDLRLPGTDGVAVCRRLAAESPDSRVIILSAFDQLEDIRQAFLAGARGYVLKNADGASLIRHIRAVAAGEVILDPQLTGRVMNLMRPPAEGVEPLTERELEVVRLVAAGLTTREIARKLFLHENTVKTHVQHAMAKLRVANRAELAAEATRRGLV